MNLTLKENILKKILIVFGSKKLPYFLSLRNMIIIYLRYLYKFKKFPDIKNGEDFNSKISWLMIYDRSPLHILLADKIESKKYINKVLGSGFTIPIILKTKNPSDFNQIDNKNLVIKTNHSSGKIWFFKKNNYPSILEKEEMIKNLNSKFGIDTGEWYYQYISPYLFAEEFFGDQTKLLAAEDYKLHCSNGEVMFIQHIFNRFTNTPYEIIYNVDGSVNSHQLDHDFKIYTHLKSIPNNWSEMIAIAKNLSRKFKYIRIDMYNYKDEIKIGELTFHPKSGRYEGKGQIYYGRKIQFNKK